MEELIKKPDLLEKVDREAAVGGDVYAGRHSGGTAQAGARSARSICCAEVSTTRCGRSPDLQPGMVLEGVVTNVTKFGAFVDVGVHQDGLVHISELSNRYIKDPRRP